MVNPPPLNEAGDLGFVIHSLPVAGILRPFHGAVFGGPFRHPFSTLTAIVLLTLALRLVSPG